MDLHNVFLPPLYVFCHHYTVVRSSLTSLFYVINFVKTKNVCLISCNLLFSKPYTFNRKRVKFSAIWGRKWAWIVGNTAFNHHLDSFSLFWLFPNSSFIFNIFLRRGGFWTTVQMQEGSSCYGKESTFINKAFESA